MSKQPSESSQVHGCEGVFKFWTQGGEVHWIVGLVFRLVAEDFQDVGFLEGKAPQMRQARVMQTETLNILPSYCAMNKKAWPCPD